MPCGPGGDRLPHRLADHLAAAEDRLVARAPGALRSSVTSIEQVGVGQPDAVAGRRPVERGVARRGRCSAIVRAAPASGRRAHRRARTSATVIDSPGSNRTDVPAGMSSRNPPAAARSNASAGLVSANA